MFPVTYPIIQKVENTKPCTTNFLSRYWNGGPGSYPTYFFRNSMVYAPPTLAAHRSSMSHVIVVSNLAALSGIPGYG